MFDGIFGFGGEYHFLSNFYLASVVYDGIEYPSVEHAYQAQKSLDTEYRRVILNTLSPGKAKRLGNIVELRTDWTDEFKLALMLELVRAKFKQNKNLSTLLLQTCDLYIEETNTWSDVFWGVCDGIGRNHLGKILMLVRQEIRDEQN